MIDTVTNAVVDTFLHYLKQSVDAGHAQVTVGEFPKQIGKPKSLFSQPVEDPRDKTIERLTAILYAQLTPAQQKQVQEMVD